MWVGGEGLSSHRFRAHGRQELPISGQLLAESRAGGTGPWASFLPQAWVPVLCGGDTRQVVLRAPAPLCLPPPTSAPCASPASHNRVPHIILGYTGRARMQKAAGSLCSGQEYTPWSLALVRPQACLALLRSSLARPATCLVPGSPL